MASRAFIAAPSASPPLLRPLPKHNLNHALPLHSSFHGFSLKLPRQSISVSLADATPSKPHTVVAATKKAVAVLKDNSKVEDVVTLSQEDGPTTLNVHVTGLTLGLEGFPLNEHGDTTNGCMLAGAHSNLNMSHGTPEDEIHHVDDLGNIVANADDVAEATIVDNQIPLSGPDAVFGSAFFVHELEEDFGRAGTVPKKRVSLSKRRIRKNIWKRKGYTAYLKAYSLAKSILTGRSKSFWTEQGKKEKD